jgi:hypothetical protein
VWFLGGGEGFVEVLAATSVRGCRGGGLWNWVKGSGGEGAASREEGREWCEVGG